jgi:predicted nucleic acid-binding protein
MNLVDTDVIVDCLRGIIPAQEWLKQLSEQPFAVPAVAAMKLVMGCRDRADLERIQRFLATYEVIWPEASEFAAAYQLLLAHRLSSGLNIPDCLIAATALARGARLYTFNFKHFQTVPGLDVKRPYSRT